MRKYYNVHSPSRTPEVPVKIEEDSDGGIRIKVGIWNVVFINPDGTLTMGYCIPRDNSEGLQVDDRGAVRIK